MDENIENIRGLLVEVFIQNEPNNLITKLFEFEDKYIIKAYKEQNRILNESISTEKENNEIEHEKSEDVVYISGFDGTAVESHRDHRIGMNQPPEFIIAVFQQDHDPHDLDTAPG